MRSQATEKLEEVQAAYAEQDREWQQLQANAGGWLEGAERTYAALQQEDDGGGWLGALVGGAIGAAVGATGASALGLTGSEVTDMVTLSTVAGAEIGGGGDGSATLAVAEQMNAETGVAMGPVAGPQSTTAALAGVDPSLQGTFESLQARLTMMANMSDADAGLRGGRPVPTAPSVVAVGPQRRFLVPVRWVAPPRSIGTPTGCRWRWV